MKILSSKQIREADQYTIEHEPIASIDLMERAATSCFKWIVQHFNIDNSFKIFCGTGNNGGDGLAIARMLSGSGYHVAIYIIHSCGNASEDFKVNETRLRNLEKTNIIDIASIKEIPEISQNDVVIDALFGTGLNKPVKGITADAIKSINQSGVKVISIDIPSGLFADQSSNVSSNQVVKSTYTLSFQVYKLAFFFAENAEYVGEVIILPIGLNEKFISSCQSNFELLEEKHIQRILKKRNPFSHKGNYGHAAIVAGSFGKMGAAVLAAKACLRTGAGLLTAHIPECGYEIMQTSVPEAMVSTDDFSDLPDYDALGIGPGLGVLFKSGVGLKHIIKKFRKPIVFDADAINGLSENKEWMDFVPVESIFTPHPKEFERLVGKSNDHFERNKMQIEFSKRYNVFVILKGKYTCITCPDGMCYFNPTGNPGMAKGGSGDALTGMLTGLLAQGYSSKETCIAGVYLHGLAGDIAVKETGEFSLLASDIIENIGKAFSSVQSRVPAP
jgi:NAD(P)H-hydrate epimerase